MPLLHQTMVFSLRLNRQAVKHARLADGEIADIDHLLHFAFAFSDDLAGLEGDELAELVFRFAQRIAKPAYRVAAHRSRRRAPFQKSFLRARNRLVIIVGRSLWT